MKDVRIGNDIAVRWSLTKDGEPFDLTGLPLTLYLKSMYGKSKVEDFSVKDNSIEWTFWGKDQKNTGVYSLVLVANEGVEGMMTTDACDFVHLVPCSCKISDREDSCGVETETIEVQSEVEFFSGASIEVDTTLSPNSPNPIANFAVHNEFERVWDKIDSSQVVTFDSLTDAEKIKEVFNHWHLEKFLKQPISCYIKEEGNEETYQIATLIVEKYDSDYKLNFITFNATSQFKEYDENGEDMGYYNPEWQWSAKSRLINGICNSYLIQSSGYVMHLGKGALIIADEALDVTSERPISNKAVTEAIDEAKELFIVVDTLPKEGIEGKIYLTRKDYSDDRGTYRKSIFVNGVWEDFEIGSVAMTYEKPSYITAVYAWADRRPCICRRGTLAYYLTEADTDGYIFTVTVGNVQKRMTLVHNGWKSEEEIELGSSYDDSELREAISGKQDALVSGESIKTINGESLLGSGNIEIEQLTNKTTSLSESSTNTQYPSAKAVYDFVQNAITTTLNEEV